MDALPCFAFPIGIRVVHMIKLHVFTFLVPQCDVRCDINVKFDVRLSLVPFVL